MAEMNQREDAFAIWVGNLRKYTEGDLEGDWIRLPQKDAELDRMLNDISNGVDELMIMDIDIGKNCSWMRDIIGEYSDIHDLNVLAKLIGASEHPAVETYLTSGGDLSKSELANLLFQEEKLPFFSYEFEGSENPVVLNSLSEEEKLGYTMIEQDPNLKSFLGTYEIGTSTIGSYVDVGAIGRDFSLNGYVDLHEKGYLDTRMGMPDLNAYSMDEIKQELQQQEDMKMQMEIRQKEVVRQRDRTPEKSPKL